MIPKELEDAIKSWIDQKKYGCMEINFQGGKIMNFNLRQSILVKFQSNSSDTKITANSSTPPNNL